MDKILDLKIKIENALRTIYDPEIPVNIFDLGLIYNIEINEDGKALVIMTLTTPNCPVAEILPIQVKEIVSTLEGISEVEIKLTFDPPWSKEMLSEEAQLELGLL